MQTNGDICTGRERDSVGGAKLPRSREAYCERTGELHLSIIISKSIYLLLSAGIKIIGNGYLFGWMLADNEIFVYLKSNTSYCNYMYLS